MTDMTLTAYRQALKRRIKDGYSQRKEDVFDEKKNAFIYGRSGRAGGGPVPWNGIQRVSDRQAHGDGDRVDRNGNGMAGNRASDLCPDRKSVV